MKNSAIFTKKSMGLDNKVWVSMLIVILLSFGLYGYRLIDNSINKACIPVAVKINGQLNTDSLTFSINERLFFSASNVPGSDVNWFFSDNNEKQEGYTTSHIFRKTGIFQINITVNGKCDNFTKVHIIKPAPVVIDSSGNIIEYIKGPDNTQTGKEVIFTTDATSGIYEWTILNNQNYKPRLTKDASFKFNNGGEYIVQLKLDNDNTKRYTKSITVEEPPLTDDGDKTKQGSGPKPTYIIPPIVPKPSPVDTAKPVVPTPEPEPSHKVITNALLKAFLEQVASGAKTVKDFDIYLCSGGETKVLDNKDWTTFAEFCKKLQSKKIEIQSVEQGKNNDCIMSITVKSKKKGWWNKIF